MITPKCCKTMAIWMLLLAWSINGQAASAQDDPSGGPQPTDVGAEEAGNASREGRESEDRERREGLNLLRLLTQGGYFMLPLSLMSLLVIAISVERLVALRRSKVIPSRLVNELGRLSMDEQGFDPREAYRLSSQTPSPAASVLRAMLLKVGRPQTEVEHAVEEASQREADRMHFNVRWLTLCAAVAPLVGLLGTVWGMIEAFYETTQLVEGQDKAEQLADGIYTALVTTLCGLMIAIPAAIFAHFCESRITVLFHEIDEFIINILPQVERFEGRVRFSRNVDSYDAEGQQQQQQPNPPTRVPEASEGPPPEPEHAGGTGASRGGSGRRDRPVRNRSGH